MKAGETPTYESPANSDRLAVISLKPRVLSLPRAQERPVPRHLNRSQLTPRTPRQVSFQNDYVMQFNGPEGRVMVVWPEEMHAGLNSNKMGQISKWIESMLHKRNPIFQMYNFPLDEVIDFPIVPEPYSRMNQRHVVSFVRSKSQGLTSIEIQSLTQVGRLEHLLLAARFHSRYLGQSIQLTPKIWIPNSLFHFQFLPTGMILHALDRLFKESNSALDSLEEMRPGTFLPLRIYDREEVRGYNRSVVTLRSRSFVFYKDADQRIYLVSIDGNESNEDFEP